MSLPDTSSLSSYGGALQDYSPVIDSTTDRPAAGANQAYTDTAFLGHVGPKFWARMTLNGSATPVLVTWDAGWNNNMGNAAPTLARSSGGVYTITNPATIVDEIPSGFAGYNPSGHTLNLRMAWGQARGGTTFYHVQCTQTSATVTTVYVYPLSGGVPTLGDPGSAVDVDCWAI